MKEPLFFVWWGTFLRCVFERNEYHPGRRLYSVTDAGWIAELVTETCRSIRESA